MKTIGERCDMPRKNVNLRAVTVRWDGTLSFDREIARLPVVIGNAPNRPAALHLSRDDLDQLAALIAQARAELLGGD